MTGRVKRPSVGGVGSEAGNASPGEARSAPRECGSTQAIWNREVDFTADNAGLTLFHCHMPLHMDDGFMALFEYA
jgi:FtsP/CotA-like multicopper oxidase with cupredoxin domain